MIDTAGFKKRGLFLETNSSPGACNIRGLRHHKIPNPVVAPLPWKMQTVKGNKKYKIQQLELGNLFRSSPKDERREGNMPAGS